MLHIFRWLRINGSMVLSLFITRHSHETATVFPYVEYLGQCLARRVLNCSNVRIPAYTCLTCFVNLNGIRRKEPILAIIYDRGCVRMLLSV